MYCCWAGKDKIFNSFEFARALGVYSTLIILSPIHIYITRSFYMTRNNYEMSVREPKVVILMSLLIWIRLIFESMYQLTLTLDEEVTNDSQTPTQIFNILHWFNCILILGLYFFRVWMFWYKSLKATKASAFVESEGYLGSFSSNQKYALDSWSRPKYLRSRRNIATVSIFWVVICMTLIATLHFALDCPGCIQPYQLSLIVISPFLVKSFLLLRRVKNQFGVISEYRVVISLVFFNYGVNIFLISFSGLEESYYTALIEYLFRAVLLCYYLLWLLNSVRKFALDSLNGSTHLSLSDLRDLRYINSDWCCKGSILEWQNHNPNMKDFSLPDILSGQWSFNLFRLHVEETLCPENLLFFVDVYIHRKQLEDDPFIALSENENHIIQESARLKMKWIDEEARVAPTCREIYNLYIKPFSDLEVNISGKLRKRLVALFEVKSKTSTKNHRRSKRSQSLQIPAMGRRNSTGRFSATVLELRRSVAVRRSFLPVKVGKKIDSRLLSPSCPFNKGFSSFGYQIELSEIETPSCKKRKSERHGGFTITLNEIVETSEKSDSQDLFLDSSDLSIAHLYPVWKTLVNLLRKDSLIRFKIKHYKSQSKHSISL